MPDYRTMYDSEYLYAFHLEGREVTVQIERVKCGELTGEGGRKAKKPIVYFAGKDRGLAINKTNGKTIASLYGTDTDKWVGQWITLYPTTTQFGGEQKDCIRIRPQRPQRGGKREVAKSAQPGDRASYYGPENEPAAEQPAREPGSDG